MPAFDIPANLAFDNYTDLSTAIEDWMNRGDLSGSIPAMIALAESRIRRELQPFFSETSVTIEVDTGVGPLPTGFDMVRHVTYDGGDVQAVSPQHGRQFPDGDVPRGYTLEANSLYLWPACTVNVTMTYQPRLTALSDSAPTNDLLSSHPDIYFFGAMVFAEGYVANDNRASLFKQLFDEALAETKRFFSRQRRTGIRLASPAVIV